MPDPAEIEQLGVCISCGAPWPIHRSPARDEWLLVDDPDDAPPRRAAHLAPIPDALRAIVAVSCAEYGLSAGGRLCSRCHKIGRVDADGVCTFCLADERN